MSAAQPNLLVLLCDQMRWDVVSASGSPVCRTPHLDRLAAEGALLERAYTPCPLCTPARAALVTGRYPHSHGLTANTHYAETPTPRLREGERMLFEPLAAAGYRCGYVGKWHLSTGDGADEARRRGLADFVTPGAASQLVRAGLPPRDDLGGAQTRTMEGDHPPMAGAAPYPAEYHPDHAVAAVAATLLAQYASAAQPFSLVVSFFGPHFPWEVPEPFASLYRAEDVPCPASFDDSFTSKPQGQRTHPWLQLAAHLTWPEWQRAIALYWGYCSFIDHLMGQVLAALDKAGLAGDTLVVATSDHGEMAGHHRMFDKGPYFYEDVMRVPLVWRWPGQIPAGTRSAGLYDHTDLTPTVLALLGVPALPDTSPVQGASHAGVLLGTGQAPRQAVFAETSAGDLQNPQVPARTVYDGRWRYVWRPGDTDELYDLQADPDELENLAGQPGVALEQARLAGLLRAWLAETSDPLREALGRQPFEIGHSEAWVPTWPGLAGGADEDAPRAHRKHKEATDGP